VCSHSGQGSGFGLPTNAANNRLIGIKCAWPTIRADGGYDPAGRWPDAQIISMRDVGAALTNKLGYGAERNIRHKEWAFAAQGKWDPGNIDMNWFRGEIAKAMRGEFSPEPPIPPTPVVEALGLPAPSNPRSDRVLLEEIWDQLRGPGGNGWPQFGDRSLVDYLAELGKYIADVGVMLTAPEPKKVPASKPAKKAPAKKTPANKARKAP
jgi:hypothetical protein